MIDTARLRESISSRGYKLSYVANMLNISGTSLTSKLENRTSFKLEEVSKLCNLLKIDSLEEKESIFFAKKDY